MTPTEITAIVGALTGSVSLGLVIYKTIREKPRLDFKIESAYHYSPQYEHYNFHGFSISLIVTNKGTRNTTIHSASLEFMFEGKRISPKYTPYTHHIEADSSHIVHMIFNIEKGIFSQKTTIHNAVLKLSHTHKTEKIIIPELTIN